MSKHFNFIHNPKTVTLWSLIIALVIGVFGYQIVSQRPQADLTQAGSQLTTNTVTGNSDLNFLESGQVTNIFVKPGDKVTAGEVLATLNPGNTLGILTQARANYEIAAANYNKLINGATNADLAVTNATLQTAQTNLQHSKETLNLAIQNASIATADTVSNTDYFFNNPYTSSVQLVTTNGVSFNSQTLTQKVVNDRLAVNQVLVNLKSGSVDTNSAQTSLQTISNYLSDLNSLFIQYASGNQTNINSAQTIISGAQNSINGQIATVTSAAQAVANAQSAITQAQANLNLKTSTARPEDVASAKAQMSNAYGAVQIAQAAYQNKILTAPTNGIVNAVYISKGQNITTNTVAVEIKNNN